SLEDDVARGQGRFRPARRRRGGGGDRRLRRAARRPEARQKSGEGDRQGDPKEDEKDQKSGEENEKHESVILRRADAEGPVNRARRGFRLRGPSPSLRLR